VCSYPRQKCKVVEGEYPGWYQLWEFPGHYQRWGYYQAGQPYTCPGDLGTACKAGDSVWGFVLILVERFILVFVGSVAVYRMIILPQSL